MNQLVIKSNIVQEGVMFAGSGDAGNDVPATGSSQPQSTAGTVYTSG